MENVEFKAELRDVPAARGQCRVLGAHPSGVLAQTDTYYRVPEGRLKRRQTIGAPPEWIVYARADVIEPTTSDYALLDETEARRRWDLDALDVWAVVAKQRELWLLENVRIHLDDVETLGHFLEFEAIVDPQHDRHACARQVQRLRRAFAPALGEPIAVGYSDLIADRS